MKRNLFAPLTLAMADEPSLRQRIVRILRANVNRETLPPKRFVWVAVGVTLAVLPLAAFQNGNARRTAPQVIELRAVETQSVQVIEVRGEAITVQHAPAQTLSVQGEAVTVEVAPAAPAPAPTD